MFCINGLLECKKLYFKDFMEPNFNIDFIQYKIILSGKFIEKIILSGSLKDRYFDEPNVDLKVFSFFKKMTELNNYFSGLYYTIYMNKNPKVYIYHNGLWNQSWFHFKKREHGIVDIHKMTGEQR